MTLVLSLLAWCCGFGCSDKVPPENDNETQTVPATIVVALKTNVPVQLRVIGHAGAYATVAVRSQVDGMLQSQHFHEGDLLKAGDLLFTIDPQPFEASLKQAKANLEKDTALEKDAEMEQQLNGVLLQSKITSQESYAQSAAAADSLRATLTADRAIIEEAELGLSYCYIRSPISGRAGLVQVSSGNVIDSQDMVLVTVNQTQPIFVDFNVPERELPRIRRCMATEHLKVAVSLPGQEKSALTGELAAIDNLVDTNTGTILVRALISNQDETIWPGQLVEGRITFSDLTNAVVVPSEAVRAGPHGDFVFVAGPQMKLESRLVYLAERKNGQAILLDGIKPGERVATGSQNPIAILNR